MSDHWDHVGLRQALSWAKESKDPNTKVGCIILGPDHEPRSSGFNGFPRGIADLPERLTDRDLKLKYTVHAELNAILAAARVGTPLKGCTLYIAATDADYPVFGGHPCGSQCSCPIIQAGIVEIVAAPTKGLTKWRDDVAFGRMLTSEAGIIFREVAFPC